MRQKMNGAAHGSAQGMAGNFMQAYYNKKAKLVASCSSGMRDLHRKITFRPRNNSPSAWHLTRKSLLCSIC